MILILSEINDTSTSEVIKYLSIQDINFIRINNEDVVNLQKLTIDNKNEVRFDLSVNDKVFNLKSINCFWYRRGRINLKISNKENTTGFLKIIDSYVSLEVQKLTQFIYYCLLKKKHIGNPFKGNVNKLYVLNLAISIGLNIPDTYIFNDKNNIFKNPHKSYITKSMFESPQVYNREFAIRYLTKEISKDDLKNNFSYSLFQEKIEKEFEIRTFYLNQKTYSMAIFSQRSSKNSIDFRNYDTNENKFVCEPFRLPQKISEKIIKLNELLDIECSSADLIYNNGKYVFLEINPVGQFGMVSKSCNYNLEKLIADYLIKLNYESKKI